MAVSGPHTHLMTTFATPHASLRAAYVVILSGVVAALQIGKLPPALPELSLTLGLSLMQAGFLLSLIQLAGMTLALAIGLLADGWGLKRSLLTGLFILGLASEPGPPCRHANLRPARNTVRVLRRDRRSPRESAHGTRERRSERKLLGDLRPLCDEPRREPAQPLVELPR